MSSPDGSTTPPKVNWQSVRRVVLGVRYALRYEYPGPVHDLRQLLMLVPADSYGSQRLLAYEVLSTPSVRPRYSADRFGNRLCHLAIGEALGSLELSVDLQVELSAESRPAAGEHDPEIYLAPSPLAEPWPELQRATAALHRNANDEALAGEIMDWVHAQLRYQVGVTGVSTTAQDALALGAGVCQDYAHLMIAVCRQFGLPARYVSGHMPDEGVMHAWAEVLLPQRAGGHAWRAFDPTHARRAGIPYVTVAVGRDFSDVSPTRGSFRAPYSGQLAAVRKQSTVLQVEY